MGGSGRLTRSGLFPETQRTAVGPLLCLGWGRPGGCAVYWSGQMPHCRHTQLSCHCPPPCPQKKPEMWGSDRFFLMSSSLSCSGNFGALVAKGRRQQVKHVSSTTKGWICISERSGQGRGATLALLASGNPEEGTSRHPCQIEYKLQITVHVTVTMGNLKQLVSEYIQDITELLKKKKKKGFSHSSSGNMVVCRSES